jgi:hypothetical protein
VQQKDTDNRRKKFIKKCNSQHRPGCSTLVQNKLVMYVSIDKQLISVQNCFGILSQMLHYRGVTRHLLIANVPVARITLCHEQHFVHELWVEWDTSTE